MITRFLTLNFTQNFWKKSSEIRRILAENLRKKLAVGASVLDLFDVQQWFWPDEGHELTIEQGTRKYKRIVGKRQTNWNSNVQNVG